VERLEDLRKKLHRLYEEERRGFFLYALSIVRCGDRAEDAVHDAFASVLRAGRCPRDLKCYVYRSVRNAAIDQLRRGVAQAPDSMFDLENHHGQEPPVRERIEIERLLQRLSEDERESISLKIFMGLTFEEIAEIRGAPPNTVASWYRRGLEKMRTMMEEP
jgi:RNA polymerase sigma-70 factor (ECF subfamily)